MCCYRISRQEKELSRAQALHVGLRWNKFPQHVSFWQAYEEAQDDLLD